MERRRRPVSRSTDRSAGRRALVSLCALLAVAGAACATSPCDDLDDAAAEAGCANHDPAAPSVACEGEAEARAHCWLENVVDVCSPSASELDAVDACLAR